MKPFRRSHARFSFFLALLSLTGTAFGEDYEAPTPAAEVFATYEPKVSDRSPAAMAAAAKALQEALPEEGRKQLSLPLDSSERQTWTNVPPRGNEGGLRFGDASKDALEKAATLLATVLSEQGYQKMRQIMMADDLLVNEGNEDRRGGFGTANYWLVLFGEPSATEAWALQLDGHHVALNLTIKGEQMCLSPTFIGTQPYKFTFRGEEMEPMEKEVDLAFDFVNSLDAAQRASAVRGDRRAQIEAGAGKDGFQPDPRGLGCGQLEPAQKETLMRLIGLWVNDLPEPAARARMKDIEAQLEKTFFSWSGPLEPEGDASYHLYGPNLIIEYAGQDLGGNPRDHLHSIYRDPTNEYGAKLIEKAE